MIQVLGIVQRLETKIDTLNSEDHMAEVTLQQLDAEITQLETTDNTLAGAVTSLGAADTQFGVDFKAFIQKFGNGQPEDFTAEANRIAAQVAANAAMATKIAGVITDLHADDSETHTGGSAL